ncbi:RlpA-like double-psi beta-barrel-protein domain-containing protein-containing protein, partial [Crucibulum laeve]
ATYFYPGLGACGFTNGNNDFIAALSSAKYQAEGNFCSRAIRVNYNGRSVVATVVDKCPGCGYDDVDLSPAAFSALANLTLGRIPVEWDFI